MKDIWEQRAAVFEKLGRIIDALKDSKRVIDLDPDHWKVGIFSLQLRLIAEDW